MSTSVSLIFRDGAIEGICESEFDPRILGLPYEVRRASHIEPDITGTRFVIYWAEWIQPYVGKMVESCDENGAPFFTKKAAEEYERRQLETSYFLRTSDH